MFSWLNSAQEAIETARSQFFYDLQEGGATPNPTDDPNTNLWELIGGRGRGWSVMLDMLAQEENFYVINHTSVLSSPLLESLGIKDSVEARSRGVFEGHVPDTFMQQSTTLPSVSSMHFSVMPRLVSDEVFWKNLYWRLLSLSDVTDLTTGVELACLFTNEPKPVPQGSPRHRNVGVENSAFQQTLRNEIERVIAERKWVDGKVMEVSGAIENAKGCLTTLHGLRSRGDQTDLVSSLVESCTFHKTKVGSLLGDLASCSVEALVGTELSPLEACGTLYRELMDVNMLLKDALVPKEAVLEETTPVVEPTQPDTTPDVPEVDDLIPLPEDDDDDTFIVPNASDEFDNISTPSPTTQASGKLPSEAQTNEDEFNAKLPWDDD